MSKSYYQVKFVGVVTVEAADEFEAGMKFKELEYDMNDVDISDVEVMDV